MNPAHPPAVSTHVPALSVTPPKDAAAKKRPLRECGGLNALLQTEKFNIGRFTNRKSLPGDSLGAGKIAHFFTVDGRRRPAWQASFRPLAGRSTNAIENACAGDNL